MSAFGQAGSAILPFITGTMAAQLGIQSLQPLCVKLFLFFLISEIHFCCSLFGMMIVVGVVWAMVPKGRPITL